MSKRETSKHQFQSKDGLFYESYEAARAANILYNEQLLREKGLDHDSFNAMKPPHRPTPTAVRRSRPVLQPALNDDATNALVEPRRSDRIRKIPPTTDADNSVDMDDLRPLTTTKKVRRSSTIMSNCSNRTKLLSEGERSKMNKVKWMEHFEIYLLREEKLSQQNYRSVMRQIDKLVSGEGVTYSRWSDSVVFYSGKKVTLADDFDELYEQAVAFEGKHGRDLGNGKDSSDFALWGLR